MSMDVEGIFPHHLSSFEELESLPARLRPALAVLLELERAYFDSADQQRARQDPDWFLVPRLPKRFGLTMRQEWEQGHGPEIVGPAPMPGAFCNLVFGRSCFYAGPFIKWRHATHRPALLYQARELFREIAQILNCGAFIVIPDNGGINGTWVDEGLTFEQIQGELTKDGSVAIADLEDFWTGPGAERSSYYVENCTGRLPAAFAG